MIIEADVYFEHFGIKGQRWGVRKQQVHDFGKKHEKGLKIGAGIALIAGPLVVSAILKRNGNLKIREANKRVASLEASTRLFQAHRGIKLNELNVAHKAGKINTEQGYRLAALFDRDLGNKLGRAAVREGVNPIDRFGLHPKAINSIRGPRQIFKMHTPADFLK